MDIATLVGILLGMGAIIGSILLMTPDMGMFVSVSSFGIVFGGMLASVAVAFPLKDVLQLGTAIGAVFKGGRDTLGGLVDEAVEAAEAGRKGTADLEKHIDSIGSFFFKDGVQMVIDGYSLEEITEILNTRVDYRELRENTQAGLFKSMGVQEIVTGALTESNYIDHLIVSTDSIEISELCKKVNVDVPFIRPEHLSTDSAKAIGVIPASKNF